MASHTKSETDLSINIRKATNPDETAPKRKHVRSCIVYTWDHKSGHAFWAALKVQPLLADEVQTFKALITVHKVLQEGHPHVIREALANRGWIESLNRGLQGEGMRGYGALIREYVYFLLAKLAFHQQHPEFSGTFEYEEYVSLKATNDPNEGYETVSDLMLLQDKIDQFQKLIFSHFRNVGNNECRISALVPLVAESYGIYKFATSMLRAMHSMAGDDAADALEPLRNRYDAQHFRLVKFYYECSNLRYLTSLVTIPKLPADPPDLLLPEDGAAAAPRLPARPKTEIERAPTPPRQPKDDEPDEISEFWKEELERQNREFEEQQRVLEAQRLAQQQAQQLAQEQARRDFEDQQRRLAEQQRLQLEALAAQQAQSATQGRLAELEQENLAARAQYERDQLMLQQYDQRVRAIEGELEQLRGSLGQQLASRDDQVRALQEQVATWRAKYEALAKLYSQLRTEHLDLLQRFKAVQLKAASAHEAVERRDKLERELKTKNLELADMIRERDRALHDRDRLAGANKDEVERLRRELRLAADRADNAERSKGSEVSALLARYNREVADLEEALRAKSAALDEAQARARDGGADVERLLRDKEEELEVYRAGMDQALVELDELRRGGVGDHLGAAVDADALAKLGEIVDAVLQAGAARVDDALYELDSPLQAGNQDASPPYVLSQVEKASAAAMEFATAFNGFIADGPNTAWADLVRAINLYAASMADVCADTKGLARLAGLGGDDDDKKAEQLVAAARQPAHAAMSFFRAVQSVRLDGMDPVQKTDVVINCNNDAQLALQRLARLVEGFAPGAGRLAATATDKGNDLGDLVQSELSRAADAIAAAAERLAKLRSKPRDGFSAHEVRVHDSILDAALAITDAIARLIRAATATQDEIVQAGRGSSSRTAFYKKNNRWTEGLISAAKAVASSTGTLIETADGVLSGRNSPEQLIVASNAVAASTAQLVAASRVKAGLMSASREALEDASKAVGAACRSLVRQVQAMIRDRQGAADNDKVDYASLGAHEFKVREMEQQVEILQLENALSAARHRLGEMRKISYQEE